MLFNLNFDAVNGTFAEHTGAVPTFEKNHLLNIYIYRCGTISLSSCVSQKNTTKAMQTHNISKKEKQQKPSM